MKKIVFAGLIALGLNCGLFGNPARADGFTQLGVPDKAQKNQTQLDIQDNKDGQVFGDKTIQNTTKEPIHPGFGNELEFILVVTFKSRSECVERLSKLRDQKLRLPSYYNFKFLESEEKSREYCRVMVPELGKFSQ